MSMQLLRKYIDIISEDAGRKHSKDESQYIDNSITKNKCSVCKHFQKPYSCKIVEGRINPDGWCKYFHSYMNEKWDKPTIVSQSEKGKYHSKTKTELLKSYNKLKKSGPHKKGSPEYGRMRELAFAIRAKSDWGKVS